MAFKSADLAIRLGPFNAVVADNGYKVLIYCGAISATDEETCGGTNADVLLEGRLDIEPNLTKLQLALREVMAHVDAELARLQPQPDPPQPVSPQSDPSQPEGR